MKTYKINSKSREAMHKLLDVVINAENKGYAAWFNYSGHVNWMDVSVAMSPDDYHTKIIDSSCIWVDPKHIDESISEIKRVTKDIKVSRDIAEAKKEKEEKELLVELQNKYHTK